MQEKAIEAIVTSFIKEITKSTRSVAKAGKAEIDNFFQKGLQNYIAKQHSKFIFVKTVLKGNTPVNFYDVYFPLSLEYEETNLVKDRSLKILDKLNRIIIIGDAGSGKSMLVKHLFLRSLKRNVKIPICIELRYLKEEMNAFKKYLENLIFEHGIVGNSNILERLLKAGRFVFYLDGYDEIAGENRQDIAKEIDLFTYKYNKNQYILTSRPYTNIENIPRYVSIRLSKLTKSDGDINGFIELQLKNETELSEEVKRSIEENRGTYIDSFLTNPLLLSLYILTYQSNSSIPDKKSLFYGRVLNALFTEHDAKTKLCFTREKKTGLSQEEFESILKIYSSVAYYNGDFSFVKSDIYSRFEAIRQKVVLPDFNVDDFIYDMKVSSALWIEDGGYISFAHRSIQEYFCALFMKELDDSKKDKIYKKLLDRTGGTLLLGEIAHLLSLCEEIDPKGLVRYYKIPIFEKFESLVKDEKTLIQNIINFLIPTIDIKIKKQGKDRYSVRSTFIHYNKNVQGYGTYHDKLIAKIFYMFRKLDIEKLIESTVKLPKNSSRHIELTLAEHHSFLDSVKNEIIIKELDSVFVNFKDYTQEELEKSHKYLERIDKERSDIIDML